ncbi:DUF1345 domain-containing protein [Methylobacterium oxalidis]|uniref:Membrane protein n=1 Tax=Methylobacterium oxalidis TaxID=944322 RepID=A0A512J591_9HYPH|nr:DUF1345 domain-containing protein [Methylobacterium oxalidis]GEP05146.1 membrane protein [Methylobacterium oxalidis]GJE31795.1 hypothetical protein LDDCCGHA_1975 [Methylobacterium oxalidis]GLS62562.1 membrane protein [Methylobacterium oxalidis]
MINPLRAFWLRPRLLGSLILVAALAVALPFEKLPTRLLLGWCLGVVVYVVLVCWQAARRPDELREEASRLDDSAMAISVFALLAAAASIGAVAMLVLGERGDDPMRAAHLALAAATLVSAWGFVQVVFAIHYAHLYYGEAGERGARGGLDFNGDAEPDFWDFLYFSVTIGATSQTSDTDVTSKMMRRVVTLQTIYAFFFNTSILALGINLAAGFAQR